MHYAHSNLSKHSGYRKKNETMLKILVVCTILLLIYSYEHTRLQNAYHDCTHQNAVDRELLLRDICLFAEERLRFTDTVDCVGAERRQRSSILMCTLYKWSVESAVAEIWQRLTHSYWSIVGILIPLLLGYMYFWSQRKLQMDMMGKFGEILGKREKRKTIRDRERNAISYR